MCLLCVLNGATWTRCSPLNDLLEKEDFTLEQVLEEDELIQEVKTRNTKLLELYVLHSCALSVAH